MRQKRGMVTERVGDGYLIVPTEGEQVDTVVSVNESGGFVWKLLEKDRTEAELIDRLVEHYEISREVAEQDLAAFLEIIASYIE